MLLALTQPASTECLPCARATRTLGHLKWEAHRTQEGLGIGRWKGAIDSSGAVDSGVTKCLCHSCSSNEKAVCGGVTGRMGFRGVGVFCIFLGDKQGTFFRAVAFGTGS